MAGTAIDGSIIAAQSSTKNAGKAREPEMHSTQKGNQWHFGKKAHSGFDSNSGLVHSVRGTPDHANDVTGGNNLLHGEEIDAFGDAGYRQAIGCESQSHLACAMRPGKRKALSKDLRSCIQVNQLERLKADMRAKVEPRFRVTKHRFGHFRVRYKRGQEKHGPVRGPVCVVPPVNDAPQIDRSLGMCVLENGKRKTENGKRKTENGKRKTAQSDFK